MAHAERTRCPAPADTPIASLDVRHSPRPGGSSVWTWPSIGERDRIRTNEALSDP